MVDEGIIVKNRRILFLVVGITAISVIALLLFLGNNTSAPELTSTAVVQPHQTTQSTGASPKTWVNPQYDSPPFPKDAADPNYTILCANKKNVRQEYTTTGSFVRCEPGYYTIPVSPPPKAQMP
jgi:hypothetical protein